MYDSKPHKDTMNKDGAGFRLSDFVLLITIVLSTIANFTDFSFSFYGLNRITAITILIYIVTTMTYGQFFSKGKIEGKKEDSYKSVIKEYDGERASVLNDNLIVRIPGFIDDYVKNELIEYRKGILVQYDISYDEYVEKYMKMNLKGIFSQKMPLNMKLAIWKCNRAKPTKITKSDIISNADNYISRRRPIGMSGHRSEQIDKVSKGTRRIFITLFSGAVGVDLVFNFTWISVVTWAIRMLPIMTALVTGQMNGFKNITETEVSYKKNQIYMIKMFKEWAGKSE